MYSNNTIVKYSINDIVSLFVETAGGKRFSVVETEYFHIKPISINNAAETGTIYFFDTTQTTTGAENIAGETTNIVDPHRINDRKFLLQEINIDLYDESYVNYIPEAVYRIDIEVNEKKRSTFILNKSYRFDFGNWLGSDWGRKQRGVFGIKLNIPLLFEHEDKITFKVHYRIYSRENMSFIMMRMRGIALKENYKEA